jgi:DNA polymerase-3 subunit delta'
MLTHNNKKSYILISSDIDNSFQKLKEELSPSRVVGFIHEDEFKIEHAKAVINEAYISESKTKYIVLGSKNFNNISQNALLKVLEEPPRNIEFIIISPTKSNLLQTIRSRLPIIKGKIHHEIENLDISFLKLEYSKVFEFLKTNSRIGKNDAKLLIEALYYKAIVIDKILLSSHQLENFDKAYRLLELNSKPQNVIAMLLMSFTGSKQ